MHNYQFYYIYRNMLQLLISLQFFIYQSRVVIKFSRGKIAAPNIFESFSLKFGSLKVKLQALLGIPKNLFRIAKIFHYYYYSCF